MLQLRIKQHPEAEGRHRVDLDLTGDGAPRAATATFPFSLSPQDEEDLRWYLEEFLLYPQEPAPKIARRVEGRMAEIGTELFQAVFQANDDSRRIWSRIEERLPETRIEIISGVTEAATIPWELLREPSSDAVLALTACSFSFVRTQPGTARVPHLPAIQEGKVRILLIICRPHGAQDVPFRSVANQILRGLGESNCDAYDLVVLRPPTFEQLGKVLHQAHRDGQPYRLVHFDGHGVYTAGPLSGKRGYLWFENPQLGSDGKLVDGTSLGRLLRDTGVSVLALNACRSAYAEQELAPDTEITNPDSHDQSLRSLAQEVMDAGVAGVVAMRYNLYVVTAAQLVGDLYSSLVRGATLGEAVTLACKNLADVPLREVVYKPLPLQDWAVPVVYEATPLQLFPKSGGSGRLKIKIAAGETATAGGLDSDLPPPPDAGFFGRDETLLALDRAFDQISIVLLHAYAGSGKTTTAAEFARWYSLTGGVEGPVLFTTFERYLPLPRVLDQFGQVFGPALESSGVHWLALDNTMRRQVALQVLAQIPVLWIWDNIEPVAGFPAGTESAWSAEEQEELLRFLRDLREAKAKVLLTSRRDEQSWLGDLPTRVVVPPMRMTESLQLVRAMAAKQDRRLTDVEDWRPLLSFAQGNPMTLTVVARQVLHEGLKTKEQIEALVTHLRSGEAAFPDEASEGRSRSLGASLAYGFKHAFNEEERKKLALLHLFQGFVNVDVLCELGSPENSWCLPEMRGVPREEGIALLNRTADLGLLDPIASGFYRNHPALPWFFKTLFEQSFPDENLAAVRAFVEAMGELGDYFFSEYDRGNRDVLRTLQAEEANLLHARKLARTHGWKAPVISTMQGLLLLYKHTGRQAAWKRLVEEIVPEFVDPKNDGPLPGQEDKWSLVTQYRVHVAEEERQWAEAGRLQAICVDWDRQHAAPVLDRPVGELDCRERNAIRNLAVSLLELGQIRRELVRADCVAACREALALSIQINEQSLAAICAFNLGRTFSELTTLRDLAEATRLYRTSLALREEHDNLGRGQCLAQLGRIAWESFCAIRDEGRAKEELLEHLDEALDLYHQALALLPEYAVDELGVIHNALGTIYTEVGDFDSALPHYREAVRRLEQAGSFFDASVIRFNVALALIRAGRRVDALEYAKAALLAFESYGERAAEMIERTHGLIAKISGR